VAAAVAQALLVMAAMVAMEDFALAVVVVEHRKTTTLVLAAMVATDL
jgi:hypothetical protein